MAFLQSAPVFSSKQTLVSDPLKPLFFIWWQYGFTGRKDIGDTADLMLL